MTALESWEHLRQQIQTELQKTVEGINYLQKEKTLLEKDLAKTTEIINGLKAAGLDLSL